MPLSRSHVVSDGDDEQMHLVAMRLLTRRDRVQAWQRLAKRLHELARRQANLWMILQDIEHVVGLVPRVQIMLELFGRSFVEERRQIGWVRDSADLVIDTSALSPHQFKQILMGHFALGSSAGTRLSVMSFSYRRGLPREADLVFVVRFLKNPHYVPELKPLSGLDAKVAAFIATDPDYAPFIDQLEGLVGPLLPRFNAVNGAGNAVILQ